jgi:predicted membrane protein (TIGR00267 family)
VISPPSIAGQRQLWLQLKRSSGILRRYFVVNGFDGALTMLGLLTGFYLSGTQDLNVVIGACLGATIALGVSGLSSAYLSESAERQRSLLELQQAMLADLSDSAPASSARLMPLFVALVNGAAPVVLALIIILPLWLHRAAIPLPIAPLPAAIATAFLCIFFLGVFLSRVGGTWWLLGGIKSLLIAVITVAIILLLEWG